MVMCAHSIHFVYQDGGEYMITSQRFNYQGMGGMLRHAVPWLMHAMSVELNTVYNDTLTHHIRRIPTIPPIIAYMLTSLPPLPSILQQIFHNASHLRVHGPTSGISGLYARCGNLDTRGCSLWTWPCPTIHIGSLIGEGLSATVWKVKYGPLSMVLKISRPGMVTAILREWEELEKVLLIPLNLPIPLYYGCFCSPCGTCAAILMEDCGRSIADYNDEIPAVNQ